jgi:hypothetical protein
MTPAQANVHRRRADSRLRGRGHLPSPKETVIENKRIRMDRIPALQSEDPGPRTLRRRATADAPRLAHPLYCLPLFAFEIRAASITGNWLHYIQLL